MAFDPDEYLAGTIPNSKSEIGGFDPDLYLGTQPVGASVFANQADLADYRRNHSFATGDNGVGAWGDDTTSQTIPMVALPRDTITDDDHGREVLIMGTNGKTFRAKVADKLPATYNIKNGAGIDLNPAAARLAGHPGDGISPVRWKFADEPAPAGGQDAQGAGAPAPFDPDAWLASQAPVAPAVPDRSGLTLQAVPFEQANPGAPLNAPKEKTTTGERLIVDAASGLAETGGSLLVGVPRFFQNTRAQINDAQPKPVTAAPMNAEDMEARRLEIQGQITDLQEAEDRGSEGGGRMPNLQIQALTAELNELTPGRQQAARDSEKAAKEARETAARLGEAQNLVREGVNGPLKPGEKPPLDQRITTGLGDTAAALVPGAGLASIAANASNSARDKAEADARAAGETPQVVKEAGDAASNTALEHVAATLPAYMVAGGAAGKLAKALTPEKAGALRAFLTQTAAATAGNVAASTGVRAVEGEPIAPTLEGVLSSDLPFAVSHGAGATRAARVEALARELRGGRLPAEPTPVQRDESQSPPPAVDTVPPASPAPVEPAKESDQPNASPDPTPVPPVVARQEETSIPSNEVEKTNIENEQEPPKTGVEGEKVPETAQNVPQSTVSQPVKEPVGNAIAVVDAARAERGLPPIEPTASQDFGTAWEKSGRVLADNPDAGRDLVSSLNAKPRALNDEENALLLRRQVEAQSAFDKANDAVNTAAPETLEAAKAQLDKATNALYDVHTAARAAGAETGRGLNARKMLTNEQYELSSMLSRKRAANDGQPLNDAQAQEVRQAHAKIQELSDKVTAHEAEIAGLREKMRQNPVADTRRAARAARPAKKSLSSFLDERAAAARARILAERGSLNRASEPSESASVAGREALPVRRGVISDNLRVNDAAFSDPLHAKAVRRGLDALHAVGVRLPRLLSSDRTFQERFSVEPMVPGAKSGKARADRFGEYHFDKGGPGAIRIGTAGNELETAISAAHEGAHLASHLKGGSRDFATGRGKNPQFTKLVNYLTNDTAAGRALQEMRQKARILPPKLRAKIEYLSDPEEIHARAVEQLVARHLGVDAQDTPFLHYAQKTATLLEPHELDRAQELLRDGYGSHEPVRSPENGQRVGSSEDAARGNRGDDAVGVQQDGSGEVLERGRGPAARGGITGFLDDQADAARARRLERRKYLNSGIDPSELADLAIIGASHIARGVTRFGEFSKAMLDDFGERVKPHLLHLFDQAKQIHEATLQELDPARKTPRERALKRLATVFQDQVDVLNHRLETGERLPEKGTLQYPDELKKVQQERDRLSTALRGITKRPDLTLEQRERIAANATRKSILELERRIKEGDFATKKGQTVDTPALQALRARRDTLRDTFQEMKDAAGPPKPTPEEQRLAALKKSLTSRTSDLQARLKAEDYSKKVRQATQLDEEAVRLKAAHQRAKDAFDMAVERDRLARRPLARRALDTFVKAERAIKLTGITTLGKITGATMARLGLTPLEEGVGGVLSHLPVLNRVAARAPREGGFNLGAEVAAVGGALRGVREIPSILKTGRSDLDVLYGRRNLTPHERILDAPGSLHGAIANPSARAEFARANVKRTAAYRKMGFDMDAPLNKARVASEAYQDSQRATFAQQNVLAAGYRNLVRTLETSKISPSGGYAAAKALDFLFPVVKKPLNIISEGATYVGGTVSGSVRLLNAMRSGIDKLPPEQADLILRELKKGLVGNALLALGYFGAASIGGQFQQGERRDKKDVKPGEVRLPGWMGGGTISKVWFESPGFMAMNVGATMHRISEQFDHRTGGLKGLPEGTKAALLGIVRDIPFISTSATVEKMLSPSPQGEGVAGKMIKSTVVPAVVSQAAEYLDKRNADGTPVRRAPQGIVQSVESGIPGLRQNVPYATGTKEDRAAALKVMTPEEKHAFLQQEMQRRMLAARIKQQVAAQKQRNSAAGSF